METSIGLVAETKDGERRVALDPGAVGMLVAGGARVLVQAGAGVGAGIDDTDLSGGPPTASSSGVRQLR